VPFEPSELAKFTQAGKAISQAAGVGFEEWARGEMGTILKLWAGHTEVITPGNATIEARTSAGKKAFGATKASRSAYGITVNTGKRDGMPGKVWFRHGSRKFQQAGMIQADSHFVPAWIHWKNDVWARIKDGSEKYAAELAKLKPAAQKAIGLARQSVIQSADALGIMLESVKGGTLSSGAIAKARSAIAMNGQPYQNGTGTQQKQGAVFSIEAVNRYPLNQKLRMDVRLASVIQSRMVYFNRNLEEGVFKSVDKVVARYPYLTLGK